jgi:hypothetical protein
MSNVKKLLMSAAGAAGGEPVDVTEVFSTSVYKGTGSAQTITNGLDLSGKGGLVWHKSRTSASNNDHSLFDSETVTGSTFPVVQKAWESNVAGSLPTRQPGFTFTSTGFTTSGRTDSNGTDQTGIFFTTWSFRKCRKFFDVVNYTGDGNTSKTISHNLGAVPGMIIVLGESTGDYWVYHQNVGNTKYLELNKTTAEQTSSTAWNNTTPTSSQFTVGNGTSVNNSGSQYTAYLFAHNNSDGGFGPNLDQDIIKCGTYTGTGATNHFINLGFEPQWLMIKRTDAAAHWEMLDIIRGIPADQEGFYLRANSSNTEASSSGHKITANATGFTIESTSNINGNGDTFVYVAIRRGPLTQPTTASSVFNCEERTSTTAPFFRSNSIADTLLYTLLHTTSATYPYLSARLIGTETNRTYNPPGSAYTQSGTQWDYNNGVGDGGASSNHFGYIWSRAPGFFDAVVYTMSTSGGNINHNLGVAPEMMWVKSRDHTDNWMVYHKALNGGTNPEQYHMILNSGSSDAVDETNVWNDTAPTASVFTVGPSPKTGTSGRKYIAYLFATLDGISKVGSYTGDGTTDGSKVIDCGFTNGSKLIIIKSMSAGYSWTVLDSVRGIASGSNDPWWPINFQSAEITTQNLVGTNSSGFTVKHSTVNTNGDNYLFYSVAI